MADDHVNPGRRRFLTQTTAVVGAVGALYAAVPFVQSWQPSAKAKVAGAPLKVDISKLEPGQMFKLGSNVPQWRGQPIWIIRRPKELVDQLPSNDARLKDPKSENTEQQPTYVNKEYRSIKPELVVLVGICTHLGCSPLFKPEVTPENFDPEWKGGFFCPCHGSRFDMAGRVFQGVPAPDNLKVPPYKFLDDNHLVIGVDPEGAA
jgi:ubiquinol-cytochrome c reductase iron-sulfur subunit